MNASQLTITIIYSSDVNTGLEGVKVIRTTAGGRELVLHESTVSACIPEHVIKLYFPNSNFETIDYRD